MKTRMVNTCYRLAEHYSPFGMVTPGRSFSAGDGYRFGFNGKESDVETYGNGNIYDYGFRIYNPRLGMFLSVDPLTSIYSELTPYQFASNSPINGIDLDGLEYKNKDEARFKFSSGEVHLNTENNGRAIKGMWNDYLWSLPIEVALCDGSADCNDYTSPTYMGNYWFESSKIEIGPLTYEFVEQAPNLEDAPDMPKSLGPNEKLAEHKYNATKAENRGKVGKTTRSPSSSTGVIEYRTSKGLYTANKYIAIAEGIVWAAGPIKNYFANKNLQRAEAQAKKYVDLISRDISIAMSNGVIDSELKTNSDYIGDISNWLLYGETNFGSSSIVGLSDEQYASKVTSDAKRIYYSISMTNVVQPESDPDQ